jgi:hypothetical protein
MHAGVRGDKYLPILVNMHSIFAAQLNNQIIQAWGILYLRFPLVEL